MNDGIIGATMVAHKILPGARTILRISVGLSDNAKQRLRITDWYFAHGKNKRLTARHFGVAPNTVYKWLKRSNPRNLKSYESYSTKPHRFRQSLVPLSTIELIKQLRKDDMGLSKYKLATILFRDYGLVVSASTISRVLSKSGLIIESQNIKSIKRKRRITYSIPRIRASKQMRYKHPGYLVQVDTKHLIILNKKYYQFNAVDCYSKIAYSKVYSNISSINATDFVNSIINFYPFSIESIQTDNGAEYLLHFHQKLKQENINHYFSHPHTPKDNPMIERFIQTTESELWIFDQNIEPNLNYLNHKLTWWIGRYNNYRPHQSLKYLTPMAYFQSLNVKLHKEEVFTM